MNGVDESSQVGKQPWWRDRAIVVGIIGVIATVVVGVLTYWLTAGTESREYSERLKASRNEIISAISRSIGEGKVPNKAKIQAVINSCDRQYGVKQQDSPKPEVVIDDIVERVLANEFLDAQKREDLSGKLLAVRDEPIQPVVMGESQQTPKHGGESGEATDAFRISVLFALIPLFTALYGVLRIRNIDLARKLIPIMSALAIALGVLVALFTSPAGQRLLKSLQSFNTP
jgi:hypothetical protein